MLTCVPQGLCSGDYYVSGAGADAAVSFDWMTEQGAISFEGRSYQVKKHGWGSGRWTLEDAGAILAEGQKTGMFTRTIEIRAEELAMTLRSQVFSRQFSLEQVGRTLGSIVPMHAFTRRATVNCGTEVPVLVQLFAFWLVAQMWRRAAKSQAAAAT